MNDFLSEEHLRLKNLQAIKATFEKGRAASLRLDKYPDKLLQLWENGNLEEIEYDHENDSFFVVQVLEENYNPEFIREVMSVESRKFPFF